MNDGWYQVTWPSGQKEVKMIQRNEGVYQLRDCLLEEVVIVSKLELKKIIKELKREEFECCAGYLENHRSFVELESLANT